MCDAKGAVKTFDATAAAGVKRFITVSALDVRDRSKPAPAWYNEADKIMSSGVWRAIGPYLEASKPKPKPNIQTRIRPLD